MQSEHDGNGRSEPDENVYLRLLFRKSSPAFPRVNVDEVLRDAALGEHNVMLAGRSVGESVKAETGTADSGSRLHRRAIMLKGLAGIGVCAASICVVMALDLWGDNSVLAQVQDAIRQVRTASYTVTHTTGDRQEIRWVVKVLGEDLCRVEQPNGLYLIFDVKGKRIMEVNPNESKVRITENLPVPNRFNIIATISNVKASAVKQQPGLPNREIGGIEAKGFVIEENGVQFNVWIDPATDLPLEMERRGAQSQENAPQIAEKWSDFHFDKPLDKALFAFEVPAGFAIDTRQSATAKPGAAKNYGFGPGGRKP